MTTQFLRGNATASATALFVICRHLSHVGGGQAEEDLTRSLQPPTSAGRSSDEASAVLEASLKVGAASKLIHKDGNRWVLNPSTAALFEDSTLGWPTFRGELLRRISQVEPEQAAPDLVRGMAWFLGTDPLQPLAVHWGSGPERATSGFDAIENSEQWRAFSRWAVALGVARQAAAGRVRTLVPDASTAIADHLKLMPPRSKARDWLAALTSRVPVFGAQHLLAQVPGAGTPDQISPGVAMGLLKLERAGLLTLAPSDDASDIVSIGFGTAAPRQVGTISVIGAAA